jgi:hypothetical protein
LLLGCGLLLGRALLLNSALLLRHGIVVLDDVVQCEIATATTALASPARLAAFAAAVLQILGRDSTFRRWRLCSRSRRLGTRRRGSRRLGRLLLRGLLLLDGLLLLNGRPLLRCLNFVADFVVDGDVASAPLFARARVEAALPALFAGQRFVGGRCLPSRGGGLCRRRRRRRCRIGLAGLLGGSSRQALRTAFLAGEGLSRCGRFFSRRRRASRQGGYRGLYGGLGLCSCLLLETARAALGPGQRLGCGLLRG